MTPTSCSILVCLLLYSWTSLASCQDQNVLEEQDSDLFEGDIVISENEEEQIESGAAGAGIVGTHYRWRDRTIPYVISNSFGKQQKQIIVGAMREIMKHTCLKFKPRRQQKDFVEFRGGSLCNSNVGRQGNGKQFIQLAERCVDHESVMHEIIHALGFWHEQSRTDRDRYVKVNLANVPKGKVHNFDKYTDKMANDMGVPYDYNSIMHYRSDAFVTRKGLKSIEPRNRGIHIGPGKHLSKYDIMKINRMYCSAKRRQK